MPDDESEYRQWIREVAARNIPEMQKSAIFLALMSTDYVEDAVPVLQFGLAVLLNKPIYITIEKGTPINDNVRRLARGIYEYTGPDDVEDAIKQAVEQARRDGYVEEQ